MKLFVSTGRHKKTLAAINTACFVQACFIVDSTADIRRLPQARYWTHWRDVVVVERPLRSR